MANGHGGKRPGAGKPKGSVNKFGLSVKESVLQAFQNLGGVEHMTEWARENPNDFYRIAAKLIPQQVQAEVSHKYDPDDYTDSELYAIATSGGANNPEQESSAEESDSVH